MECYDKQGRPIDDVMRLRLLKSTLYRVIRRYVPELRGGEEFSLEWNGLKHAMFKVTIHSAYGSEIEYSPTFYKTLEEATNTYEDFLVRDTPCKFVPTGDPKEGQMQLLEVGNVWKPNAGEGDVEHEDYGSW